MSDTVVRPSALPEVAYPPAVSLGAAWPWMLFGAALLALIYFVGHGRGRALGRAGHLGARVGARRAPPPRLPLPLGAPMLRNLLICGLLAGVCGGLLATGFARVVGEGAVDQAIAYEEAHAAQPARRPRPRRGIARRLPHDAAQLRSADRSRRLRARDRRPLRARLRGGLRTSRPGEPGSHRALARGRRLRHRLSGAVREVPGNAACRRRSGHDRHAHRRLRHDDRDLDPGRDRRRAPARAARRALAGRGLDARRRGRLPRRRRRSPGSRCRPSTRCPRRSRRRRCTASARRPSACSSCSGRRSASCSPEPRSAS